MPGANPTYSGSGEDILLGILFKRKPNNHTYIDVGAHIPRFGSNSYLFYLKGWHGLLLEANEALIPELRRSPSKGHSASCSSRNEKRRGRFHCLTKSEHQLSARHRRHKNKRSGIYA